MSGSSDKTIRVWKILSDDDVYNVNVGSNDDVDVKIVDHCIFQHEDGIRKILILENQPDLVLAGDLVIGAVRLRAPRLFHEWHFLD